MSPQVTESVRVGPAVMEMFDDRPMKPNNRKIEYCWLNPSDPDFKVAKELKKLAKNKLLK
ncbi:hypothetical protein SESBI_51332 [Sesbania bispinosa]|nr:hypothetical protein SESBI_51332 [Sesbania bispinosa]